MRPALQRLLLRPTSLDFLGFIVGTPTANVPTRRSRGCVQGREIGRRGYASLALGTREAEEFGQEETQDTHNPPPTLRPVRIRKIRIRPETPYGQWSEKLWTNEELDFESDLDTPLGEGRSQRLLDQPEHKLDFELWAYLLDYRQRIHGAAGTLTFWNAIRSRRIQLPTHTVLADKLWSACLDLGFQQPHILEEVLKYADEMLEMTGYRWPTLYVYTMQHFLVNSNARHTLEMHNYLFERYPPGPKYFAEMCRTVVFQKGNLKTLKMIYERNTHRNCYSKVVSVLCAQKDYWAAVEWHYFFLKNGDLPATSKAVEPLVHFLAIYYRSNAVKVTKSLVDAGVPIAHAISEKLEDTTKISREMMNLIHGKTFHVPVKAYNDHLGARWFATSWVSLDVAINAVHALGVKEIGPLSLQAIALRDPDPQSIVFRLNQLQDLGISIGNSVFSKAVQRFARGRMSDHLEGLLNSDQHPDALEDSQLQEALLTEYARVKDWAQYRRTLAIRGIASASPEIERRNLVLRLLITRGDARNILHNLSKMGDERTPVESSTIAHLLRHTLRPRRAGRRPMTLQGDHNRGKYNDLNITISILKKVMHSRSFVPPTSWREIVRRLGMLGRFIDLENLCIDLARWYGPTSSSRYRVPIQVPTSHPLHPLNILFSASLQKAIVEWGFIYSLKRRPSHVSSHRGVVISDPHDLPNVTAGITLLKQLSERGVSVDGKTVRSALFNRLVVYFAPGRSSKVYNRHGQAQLKGKLDQVAQQIDQALGGSYFANPDIDLRGIIASRSRSRLQKIERRRLRKFHALREPASRQGLSPAAFTQ